MGLVRNLHSEGLCELSWVASVYEKKLNMKQIALILSTIPLIVFSLIFISTPVSGAKPTFSDIVFKGDSLQRRADIYIPGEFAVVKNGRGDASTPYPAIIAISNNGGKDAAGISQMLQALDYGYAVVAVEYGQGAENAVSDIISAVKWIKKNGSEYRLDPGKIVLWGNSYGGYLAAIAASAGTYLQGFNTEMEFYCSDLMAQAQASEQHLQQLVTQFGADNLNNSTKVQAVVDLYGYFDYKGSSVSPDLFITPQTPPFFLMYGKNDQIVPYAQAQKFANDLKSAIGSQFVEYLLLPSTGHGGGLFDSPQFSRQIFIFLNKVLFK